MTRDITVLEAIGWDITKATLTAQPEPVTPLSYTPRRRRHPEVWAREAAAAKTTHLRRRCSRSLGQRKSSWANTTLRTKTANHLAGLPVARGWGDNTCHHFTNPFSLYLSSSRGGGGDGRLISCGWDWCLVWVSVGASGWFLSRHPELAAPGFVINMMAPMVPNPLLVI